MRKTICLILSLSLLSGCVAAWGGSYHIESETPSSIVIKYDPAITDIQAVQLVAEDHCQKFSKGAAPDVITKSGWAISTASFICKNISANEQASIEQRIANQRARENARAAQVRDMAISSASDSMRSLGDAYKANAAAYGNSASCPACQQGIQQSQQYRQQQQQEQQQWQQQKDMKALHEQIQQQQQQIDNERRDPLGGLNGRWH